MYIISDKTMWPYPDIGRNVTLLPHDHTGVDAVSFFLSWIKKLGYFGISHVRIGHNQSGDRTGTLTGTVVLQIQ